ncbi:GNAT family N-acetyltransferase [Actinoplanes sp. NPDC049668]|uniref:GNAT family N-acetyltransferase n=1 Tax=unclassified Actinoplanes TaxID=2626549 RepID=UPI0033A4E373
MRKLGLRIFEACGADIDNLGEEHGHRVLKIRGKGDKAVLIPLPPAVARAMPMLMRMRLIRRSAIMRPVIVRAATVNDVEALADVHVWTWQKAYRGKVSQEYLDRMDPSQRQPGWRRILQDRGPTATLVAENESDGVVGFICVSPSRDSDTVPQSVGEIQALYLLPAYWGQGVGQLLMDAGLRRLAEAGYREISLWVLATNDRARRFYEAGGWRPDGSTKTDDSRGFPLVEVRYRRGVSAEPTIVAPTS